MIIDSMENYLLIFAVLLMFGQVYAQSSHETKTLEQQTDNLLHITGCKIKHYYESMCQLYTYGPHQFLRCDGGDFMIGCPASYLVRQDSLGTHKSYHAIYFQSPDFKITIIPANYYACFDKEVDSVYQFEEQNLQKDGWKIVKKALYKSFYFFVMSKNEACLYKKVAYKQDCDMILLREVSMYYSLNNYSEAQQIIKTYISKFPDKPF